MQCTAGKQCYPIYLHVSLTASKTQFKVSYSFNDEAIRHMFLQFSLILFRKPRHLRSVTLRSHEAEPYYFCLCSDNKQ